MSRIFSDWRRASPLIRPAISGSVASICEISGWCMVGGLPRPSSVRGYQHHEHQSHSRLRPRHRRCAGDRVRHRAPGDRVHRDHHGGRQRGAGEDHGERAGGGVVCRRARRAGDRGVPDAAAAPGDRRGARARRVGARRRGAARSAARAVRRARDRLHHRRDRRRAGSDHAGRDRAADQRGAGGAPRAAAARVGAGLRDHGRLGRARQREPRRRIQHLGRPRGGGHRVRGGLDGADDRPGRHAAGAGDGGGAGADAVVREAGIGADAAGAGAVRGLERQRRGTAGARRVRGRVGHRPVGLHLHAGAGAGGDHGNVDLRDDRDRLRGDGQPERARGDRYRRGQVLGCRAGHLRVARGQHGTAVPSGAVKRPPAGCRLVPRFLSGFPFRRPRRPGHTPRHEQYGRGGPAGRGTMKLETMYQTATTEGDPIPKVLVVDDEPNIRELVQVALKFHGCAVTTSATGMDALALATATSPDLIVLDVVLPDIDGFEVCRRLRASDNDVPVIFLTARDTTSDTVTGLTLGGDDYITKPFSVEALVARVRAVLRRAAKRDATEDGDADDGPTLRVADLELDEEHWIVRRAGIPVELSPTEFRLLAYLMRNQGLMLSRKQLLENVWGWEFAGQSQVLETYVSYLRRKLDPLGPPLIHTRGGVGYTLRSP